MVYLKKIRNFLLLAAVLFGTGYLLVSYYSYIFSRKVTGVIMAVEKVGNPMAVVTVNGQDPSPQIYSHAVGVKDVKTGEIVTASTEDRQWAVAKSGQCVEAEFFPYPPWRLEKWGTYFNARLLKLYECELGTTPAAPVPPAPPVEQAPPVEATPSSQ